MIPHEDQTKRDYAIVAIVCLSTLLCSYHLQWGLPSGNQSWAADALGPVTVLGVIRRSFNGWNSGWYYFKYAPGHPFLMGATYLPYLGYLYASGGWSRPASSYPYGFADPERALFVLAMIGRALNVALTVGVVLLTYAIARRLLGRATALLAAGLVATCYPLVYYAHTTNVDTAYLFWLILALYCAIEASRSERWLAWLGLGSAAGMALATKEQGFAFLLPLPILALAAHVRRAGSLRPCWGSRTLMMGAAGLLTLLAANNAFYNPLGFIGRLAFLMGRPLQATTIRLVSVEFAWFKGAREWKYLQELWSCFDSAFGVATAILLIGAVAAIWRRPRAAAWIVTPAFAYYYLALRGMDLITLRYTLPLLVIACMLLAYLLVEAATYARSAVARSAVYAVIALVAGLSLLRSIELDLLLRNDPRYAAEQWMSQYLPTGAHGEVYQKPVYLPRFTQQPDVRQIPMPERTLAGLQERRPDFIVLSGVSRKSITHVWNPDWRTTGGLLLTIPEAARMLEELESGRLGYHRAADFRRRPRSFRSRITSLSPPISIWVRDVQHASDREAS